MELTGINRVARLGRIACLSLIIVSICSCTNRNKANGTEAAQEDVEQTTAVEQTSDEPVPFTRLDEKPLFNMMDPNNFVGWVNTQIKLPESWRENPLEGRVLVSFVVDTLGKVADVKVVESLNEEIDAEIVRVVTSSPDWTPGKKDGIKTAAIINLPVVFKNQQ